MEFSYVPIRTEELNAVLDKLPIAIVEEAKDTREAWLDNKARHKEKRISYEEYAKYRNDIGRDTDAFTYALELYGAITYAEARVLRRFMKGHKTDKEVTE